MKLLIAAMIIVVGLSSVHAQPVSNAELEDALTRCQAATAKHDNTNPAIPPAADANCEKIKAEIVLRRQAKKDADQAKIQDTAKRLGK